MKKNETILITGGSGFIGYNLIKSIVNKFNLSVIGLEDIKDTKIKEFEERIKYYKLNLEDKESVTEIIRKINPSFIIHLASFVNTKRDINLIEPMMKNFYMSLNVYLAALQTNNLRGIVNFGSAEEYGNNSVPFDEKFKEIPLSPYSLSKTCINYLSSYFYRNHNLPIVTLRPFVVYGDYQTNNQFIPYVIKQCLTNSPVDMTNGEQTRDFIYVMDVIDAIIKIINNPGEKIFGQTINLCAGTETSIKDVALLIRELIGSNSEINLGAIEYRENEKMRFFGKNNKARDLLNWVPKNDLRGGLKKAVDWYKNNEEKWREWNERK